jgi:2-dehydropantoate 2-reductase
VCNYGDLLEHEETEELLEFAVEEAIEVAKVKGIKLIDEDPVAHVKEVAKLTATNKSSMLQDILNKKKSEVDFISGAIVREGRKAGVGTPVNITLANLVKLKEKMNWVK